MNLSAETKAWLLAAPEPYIRYQAQRLLMPKKAEPSLLDDDPFIRENLRIISGWRNEVLTRHDKADLFIHRLAMLADLGVTRDTAGAGPLIEDLLANITPDGSFLVNIMIPQAFGGSGKAHPDWIICDLPVVVYALSQMAGKDARIRPAVKKLINLAGEEYYPCCGSIPKFKGPGPRNGLCPYANLLVARALAADAAGRKSSAAKLAANAVLDHWTHRRTKKPFLFGMGTDFLKLKFPMVWYNLLHVVSALKSIPGVQDDARYHKMADHLRRKLDGSGKATAESVYLAYKSEEWSDKKNPSRLLTVMVHQTLRGVDR
jgi:hypothetical protein